MNLAIPTQARQTSPAAQHYSAQSRLSIVIQEKAHDGRGDRPGAKQLR